jgi:hypothetical protein
MIKLGRIGNPPTEKASQLIIEGVPLQRRGLVVVEKSVNGRKETRQFRISLGQYF